jgi:glycosyltransferase involved in cell wall biosynthesis
MFQGAEIHTEKTMKSEIKNSLEKKKMAKTSDGLQSESKISLIIPVYNEAGHLKEYFDLIDALWLPCKKELVIINDASKDNSWEIIENYEFKSEVQKLNQLKNQGKGAALHRGFEAATGDIVVVQDADFEYDPEDLPRLIQPILDGKADVVYGSRFRKEGNQVHRTYHYMINRLLTILSNLMSGLYVSDMETCYKVFKADIIKNLNLESKRFGFEPEVTAKIARLKIKVHEHPISYYPRSYQEGKKITWKDGVAALRHIIYYNGIASSKSFFRDSMPEKYVPKGAQWL